MSIDAHEVYPNVWVGGWSAARDYNQNFDIIYNVAVDAPAYCHYHFAFVDGPGNDKIAFNACIEAVASEISAGRRVLVHCMAGRSRSLVIAAAALEKAKGVPFDETVESMRIPRGLEEYQPHRALLELIGK